MTTTTTTNQQTWNNAAFADLFDGITAALPRITFYAILFSYASAAALSVWAIELPLFLSIPLALAIQMLRCLAVFSPFLNANGRANFLPECIAACAALLNLFELSFSLQAQGLAGNEFWSLFLFGVALVGLSMILEIQFIHQGKKAFGLVGEKPKASRGAVQHGNQQNDVQSEDQIDGYKRQIEMMRDHLQEIYAGNITVPTGQIENQSQGNVNKPRNGKKVPDTLVNSPVTNS
jgi:hypothetical protein